MRSFYARIVLVLLVPLNVDAPSPVTPPPEPDIDVSVEHELMLPTFPKITLPPEIVSILMAILYHLAFYHCM